MDGFGGNGMADEAVVRVEMFAQVNGHGVHHFRYAHACRETALDVQSINDPTSSPMERKEEKAQLDAQKAPVSQSLDPR